MKARHLLTIAAMLMVCTSILPASPHRERALWVEVHDRDGGTTTIAVTEPIARELLESDRLTRCLGNSTDDCTVTREMLRAVLDGDEESIEVRDDEGSTVKLYMANLKVPGRGDENGRLILETYKDGSPTLRIALPEITVEAFEGKGCDPEYIQMNIGWKGLLPFLAKEGGAIYVDSEEDATEVWVYVD